VTKSPNVSVWTFVGVRPGLRAPMRLLMILGLLLLAALVTVPLARGRLTALADIRLRRPWLAVAGIATQIVIIEIVPSGIAGLHEGVHLFSYVLLGAFGWSNRRIPGVPAMMLGGALNFIAIAANGGVMPADPDLAIKVAGAEGFVNAGALEHARLQFLGDVFATPDWFPLYNVFSVGDFLIVLGVVVLLHGVSGSRLIPRRWRTATVAA
jgi:hypothetical protein